MIRSLPLLILLAAPVAAETLTGQVGCTLAWDYPADQEQYVSAFPIWIDGAWAYGAKPSDRAATCASIGITAPGTYALEIFTRAKPDSGKANSPRVKHILDITAPAPVARAIEPTNIRLEAP